MTTAQPSQDDKIGDLTDILFVCLVILAFYAAFYAFMWIVIGPLEIDLAVRLVGIGFSELMLFLMPLIVATTPFCALTLFVGRHRKTAPNFVRAGWIMLPYAALSGIQSALVVYATPMTSVSSLSVSHIFLPTLFVFVPTILAIASSAIAFRLGRLSTGVLSVPSTAELGAA